MNVGRTALIIAGLILILSVGIAGATAYLYYFKTAIVKNPVVKSETKLKEYLEIDGVLPKVLQYKTDTGQYLKVYSIMFVRHDQWKETDNCAGTRGNQGVFCFDEKFSGGQMVINIYPNLNQIPREPSVTVNRLLNLNILVILEERLGIDPDRKSLILTENPNDFVFIW